LSISAEGEYFSLLFNERLQAIRLGEKVDLMTPCCPLLFTSPPFKTDERSAGNPNQKI
jgi:hypothetical protein